MGKLLWVQKEDIGPAVRLGPAMTYDVARKRVVLFGGFNGNQAVPFNNETWEWDGESWVQVSDMGPSPRQDARMAYDKSRNRVILFGGEDKTGGLMNDTWEWDGIDWTQLADTGPRSRTGFAMTSDSKRQRVVLFGGLGRDVLHYVLFSDTWEWDGNEWTQQEDSGPSARSHHDMAYDSIRGRSVLFGGSDGSNETWEWDGVIWRPVSHTGPSARFMHKMIFDGKRVVLVGGYAFAVKGGQRDTWIWDGMHWIQRGDMGPGPVHYHAMAYDMERARVVLFNGETNSETWELFEAPLLPSG